MSFALEEPTGLTLKELEIGLLGVGRVRQKIGLPVVAVLELSLKLVRLKLDPLHSSKSVTS